MKIPGNLIKTAERLLQDNLPTILTAAGVVGSVTAAYLTGKASFEAGQVILAQELERPSDTPPKTLPEKVKLTWKLYIPAATTLSTSVACVVMANRVSTGRAAAMAAAYSLSEKAISDYREKVNEILGKTKADAVEDAVAQKRVTEAPPNGSVIMMGNGDVLFLEPHTGRYFYSTMENVKKAVNDLNSLLLKDDDARLTDFFEALGLEPTSYSDTVGWNSDKLLDVQYSTTMSPQQLPCIVMRYELGSPKRGYHSL